jgi:hypothetical protein
MVGSRARSLEDVGVCGACGYVDSSAFLGDDDWLARDNNAPRRGLGDDIDEILACRFHYGADRAPDDPQGAEEYDEDGEPEAPLAYGAQPPACEECEAPLCENPLSAWRSLSEEERQWLDGYVLGKRLLRRMLLRYAPVDTAYGLFVPYGERMRRYFLLPRDELVVAAAPDSASSEKLLRLIAGDKSVWLRGKNEIVGLPGDYEGPPSVRIRITQPSSLDALAAELRARNVSVLRGIGIFRVADVEHQDFTGRLIVFETDSDIQWTLDHEL